MEEERTKALCCKYSSPIGEILIASHGEEITGLWFTGQKYDRAGLEEIILTAPENSGALHGAVSWLEEYFSGKEPKIPLKLSLRGTAFQKRVWHELLNIPYGRTVSYGELAGRLCCKSPRAVGAAVGRNPISLVVPCHRVVGSGGSLTGYAGGMERKRYLLEIEKAGHRIDK